MDQATQDFLAQLEAANKQNLVSIYVPSQGKALEFYPLTALQLRDLIQSVADQSLVDASFAAATRKIIEESCVDASVPFTIVDRDAILIKLRTASIGPEVKVTLENEAEELVDITDIADFQLSVNNTITVDAGSCTVICNIPTLVTEAAFNKAFAFSKKDIGNQDDLQSAIGKIFLGEVAKYVTGISTNGSKGVVQDVTGISPVDRVSFIEKLPAGIVSGVVRYIDSVKKSVAATRSVTIQSGPNK